MYHAYLTSKTVQVNPYLKTAAIQNQHTAEQKW